MGILKKIQGMTHREVGDALCAAFATGDGVVVVAGVSLPYESKMAGTSMTTRIVKACADEAAAEIKAYADKHVQDFDRRAGVLAQENTELKALLKDKESAVRRLEHRLEGVRLSNKALQEEVAVLLRRENGSLRRVVDDLHCRLSGDDEVSALKAELQRAKSEIAVLRMQVDLAKGEDSELRQAVNAPQEKSESGPREQNHQPKIVPGDPPKDGKIYMGVDPATGMFYTFEAASPDGKGPFRPISPAAAERADSGRPAYVGILDSFLKHATRPVDAEAMLIDDIAAMAKEFAEANGLDFYVEVIKL